MKKLLKDNIGEIITFFITAFVLLVIFKITGLFEYTAMISDLKSQVYPLLEHLKDGISLFDFSLGIGDSLLGILYYYILSPFNILYFFIKDPNIAFITIIVLKSSFSALCCYKFLKYQNNNGKKIYLLLFSMMYALSSYFISYNMVIEFLDAYILFPLVLLGIDKIIKEKKCLLYIISFMLVIFTNYYFAYMMCIFIFIYFNYKNYVEYKEKDIVKKNLMFILLSGLVCLTMSFIILPMILEIGSYSRGVEGLFGGESFEVLFKLGDIFNHYLIGNLSNIGVINPYHFYIYTSVVVFPLIYFYYLNKDINKREKIGSTLILFILLISIGFNYINYIWHGFGSPVGFNGRFTFMFILFIIMICYKSISCLKKFALKHYIIIFSSIYILITLYSIIMFPRLISIDLLASFVAIYIFVIIMALLFKKYKFNIQHYLVGLVIIFGVYIVGALLFKLDFTVLLKLLGAYFCIFLINVINSKRNFKVKQFLLLFCFIFIPIGIYSISSNIVLLEKRVVVFLLFLFVYICLFFNVSKQKYFNVLFTLLLIFELGYNGYYYLDRFPYKKNKDDSYENVINYIKKEDKSLFYRIEDNGNTKTVNYSLLHDYYGIDYFMSTIKKDYMEFFENLGVKNYNTSNNFLLYDGSNHLVSSLLGVKYYIETLGLENDNYEKIKRIDKYDVYENINSLSLGYMVHSDLEKLKYKTDGLEYLNDIYKTMTNSNNDMLRKEEIKVINNKEFLFKVSSKKDFYLWIDFDVYGYNPIAYLNGERLENYNGTNMYYVKNKYKKEEEIKVLVELVDEELYNEISGFYVYYYNDDVYQENINILKDNSLKVTSVNNDGLEGKIQVDEDGLLFLSCLYQDNLDIYVDGVKQDKIKLLDTFIGVNLNKGDHNIILKYNPVKFYVSFIPSIVGLILLSIYTLLSFSKKKKSKKA